MAKKTFRCPQHYTDNEQKDRDFWAKSHGTVHCSYCGSMHPDVFMEHARNGSATLGPTDKNYKVYVTDPKVTYVPTSSIYENGKRTVITKYPAAPMQQKFYFEHLSEEHRREFVDLYNNRPIRQYDEDMNFEILPSEYTGKMIVGFPGQFYSLPFFMGRP